MVIALILAPPSRLFGYVLAVALLLVYTAILRGAVRRGTPQSCRCFGGASTRPISALEVWRNCVLIGIAGLGVLGAYGQATRGVDAGWAAIAVAGGLLAVAAVVLLDDVVWLVAANVPGEENLDPMSAQMLGR